MTLGGRIMNKTDVERTLFDESDGFELVRFVTEELNAADIDGAVNGVAEHLRKRFSVSCVSVREITAAPLSLRFVYESLGDETKTHRLGEVIRYDGDNWARMLDVFAKGCYIYDREKGDTPIEALGPMPDPPACVLQLPMFCGEDFLGTIDLVDFEKPHKWNATELDALRICASAVCQRLYRTNATFMSKTSRNEFDPITGLISFDSFNKKLGERLGDMLKTAPVAIVYTDIRRFKYINETYGYKKGDDLLRIAAAAMSAGREFTPDFMICRVHSDNFVSASPLPEELMPSFPDYIKKTNEELCGLLQKEFPDVRVKINTGICYVYDPDTKPATAIANANLARKMTRSEQADRPVIFTEEMMEDIKYQEYLTAELPNAIANHDLKVYYQPKINCADDSLYGAEALVRWQREDGTFIYPDKFIPLFEQNGNIVDVDFYVYREVFKYLRRRLDEGLPVVPISMNVSRIHFKSDRIVPYIKELLSEYRVPPELLEFELTENIYIKNFEKANAFVKTLQDMKIKVSMDDFGSGYSSLNVMSVLPIDTLKIDRVFLKSDELNDVDKTVLECVISMAKRLGMNVICEGVETRSQSQFLKRANCDMIQGYYYGRPMNEESFDLFTKEKLG